MMKWNAEASPRFKARITGVFYFLSMLTGGAVLFAQGRLALVIDRIATVCDIAVMAAFCELFRAVSRSLSLLAVSLSLVGLTLGKLDFHLQGVGHPRILTATTFSPLEFLDRNGLISRLPLAGDDIAAQVVHTRCSRQTEALCFGPDRDRHLDRDPAQIPDGGK
jgi:hypothetical protein